MDQLEALLAERACERLILAYARFIDSGEAEKVADLFTTDGVWESERRRWAGQPQIRAGFAARARKRSRKSRHVCANIEIDILSATEATGLTYFILYRNDEAGADPGAPVIGQRLIGDYRDRFVLTQDGWRFRHRRVTAVFVENLGARTAGSEEAGASAQAATTQATPVDAPGEPQPAAEVDNSSIVN